MPDQDSGNQRRKKSLNHYPIQIDGQKVLVVNHLFKQKQVAGKEVYYLILISRVKFPELQNSSVVIEMIENGAPITLEGEYDHGFSGNGVFELVFRVQPNA